MLEEEHFPEYESVIILVGRPSSVRCHTLGNETLSSCGSMQCIIMRKILMILIIIIMQYKLQL